jgi:hypothetical protein
VVEPVAKGERVFTSWTLEHYFKGPEDYEPLRAWAADHVYLPNYEAYAEAEKWRGEDVILRGYAGSIPLHTIMISWMGLDTFAVEWAERRDEILALESAMCQSQRPLYSIMAESPISHANLGGNVVTTVMGRERFNRFCLPVLNECADVLHEKGKLMGSHLDGDNGLWADLVSGSAMDYVEAFTPAPDTDMTLAEALEAWPDKVLWINFPSSVHLAEAARIREVAQEICELGHETNRVIVGITEDIPSDRWQESLLAISRVVNG